ncbi:hypothetical protein [Sorangium sp. So ce362]|uniref:hypothetical protein n=1 Tax=Sorangium sp. So ce362 TaxID=3133303 RepID=UPI003F6135AD
MTFGGPPRSSPRISVTKLGEYTVATPARRRAIVREQRNPKGFIVLRYERARPALVEFFAAGATDPNPLVDVVGTLASTIPSSDWSGQDLQLSSEALEAFLDICDDFDLEGLVATAGAHAAPKLSIAGVDVSVRPDVVLRGTYRGKSVVGAMKFHFSKTNVLTEDAGLNVATVMHQYVEAHLLAAGDAASPRHCAVLDVFTKRWYRAPTAFRLRRTSVAAACQEVALWWPAV